MGRKYHDKDWLKRKYLNEGKETTEIAKICDVSSETIRRWLDKHDIPRRGTWLSEENKENIRDTYRETALTHEEIAEKFGISRPHVTDLVDDIERFNDGSIYRHETDRGYISYQHYRDGEIVARFYEHQIIALLEHDYELGGENVTHHKNGWKLDNRPENLEVTNRTDHQRRELNGPVGNSGKEHWTYESIRKSKSEGGETS